MSASLESWVNLPVTTVTNCFDSHIFIAEPREIADRLERWGKWFNCEGPLVVVMVGSFTEQKDQKALIRLMGIMPTLRVKLVGEGPTKSEAQQLVKELDIDERVEFLGLVANPERVLAKSDLMIHLAHWEGFGLAALEAQAVGVPVLCSDVAGLRDLVCERALLQNNSEELLTSKIDALTPSAVTDLIDWGLVNSKGYTVEKYNDAIRISLYEA
jgi:glycosyltransferase involved in cell wall biosynthesis